MTQVAAIRESGGESLQTGCKSSSIREDKPGEGSRGAGGGGNLFQYLTRIPRIWRRFHFSLYSNHFLFLHPPFLLLHPSICLIPTALLPTQPDSVHSCLMFRLLRRCCQGSWQPDFLYGEVTKVNKAGWPSEVQ